MMAVLLGRAVPPDAVEYHLIEVPLAERFATVGLFIAQNDCCEDPVGAAESETVTVTSSRFLLSQLPKVCEA